MNKLKRKQLLQLLVFLIHLLILFFASYFFDKLLQMIMFETLFNAIQNSFKYRFHSDSIIHNPIKAIRTCKVITISVEIGYLIFCISFSNSIYSNLVIIILISVCNALLQFYIMKTFDLEYDLRDKQRLLEMCKIAHLSNLSINRLILKYIDNKSIKEIANIEGVEEGTIAMSLMRSRNKLKRV